jgi:hypothetical protein
MLIRLFKIGEITVIGATLVELVGLHLVDFSKSPEEVAAAFAKVPVNPTTFTLDSYDQWIRVGDPEKPSIVFVDGSPGSWDNFLNSISDPLLLKSAHLIAPVSENRGLARLRNRY